MSEDSTTNLKLGENESNDTIEFWSHSANTTAIIEDIGYNNELINSFFVEAIFCALYTIIFTLGLFGNILVFYVVVRNKTMYTVTNFFIANLAVSDILLCVISVPITPLYTFLGRWTFGDILCHIMPSAQGCSVYISTFTLTSIAIDRFFVIIYPFQPRMTLTTCLWIIACIWGFSIIVTLPYGIFMIVLEDPILCEEAWPSEDLRIFYGSVTFILQFAMPFFIMAASYYSVSRKLDKRARAKPGAKNTIKEETERDRKRRTNRMLMAMVTIFGVSWLPLNLINILYDFYIPIGHWKYYFLAFFVSHCIAMSSTCYNPILYAWLNENFRKEFRQVLPFFDFPMKTVTSIGNKRPPVQKIVANPLNERFDALNETVILDSSERRMSSFKTQLFSKMSKVVETKLIEVENDTITNEYSEERRSLSEPFKLQLITEKGKKIQQEDYSNN